MVALGDFLRARRKSLHFSMKYVQTQCGIADSKLSRIERGIEKKPDPYDLRKLANQYQVNVVYVFLLAGYMCEKDLAEYQNVFQNVSYLTHEEKECIQTTVNLLSKGRTAENNDI